MWRYTDCVKKALLSISGKTLKHDNSGSILMNTRMKRETIIFCYLESNWVKLKERTKIVAGLVEFLSLIIMMAIWFSVSLFA